MISDLIAQVPPEKPVLIAGPTASGKSGLALALAEAQRRRIVNADASQVYACWRVLTARPSAEEEARAPHHLFGHVAHDAPYSTGHWLREIETLLQDDPRPVIIGGTGLYFTALTEGIADIPATPPDIRQAGDALSLEALLAGVDAETSRGLDRSNRARVQRAWEVERATGRALHLWQAETQPPLLPLRTTHSLCLDASKDWLNPRIEQRFRQMLTEGGREEAAEMTPLFNPDLPAFRAIGVKEAMALNAGTLTEDEAIRSATIATRQYAKRQRTWFRRRMAAWHWINAADL